MNINIRRKPFIMGNTDQTSIFKEILESNLLSSGESLITRLQLPNVAKTIR